MWDTMVKDHCHYTGKYKGIAHQKCALRYMIPHYIPIIFHNLSSYGMHLFPRELGNKFNSGSICVIAENPKRYISFNINIGIGKYETTLTEMKQIKRQLQFIDSFRSMVIDGPLFFYQGGYHFWDLQTIIFKSNAFQTIFFITFCNENNFFTIILKTLQAFL